jgi:glycosyltransferase involved in cell wall biosynthesis
VSDEIETRVRDLTLLSVVAPACNEEELIVEFHRRTTAALGDLPFELIVVDDGSTDATPGLLKAIADLDNRVRVVTLSRNFGHQAAITAGLDRARGDATVMIDADLQDPPEVIVEMIDRWRAGADVVYGVRRERAGESRFKLVTARWFYGIMSRLSQVPIERNAGDFRLIDRNALDALNSMRERDRFIRGMTSWIGYQQVPVEYDRDARFAGETKYTTRRMIRFSLDAISSFSNVPLQAATVLGFIFSAIAFLAIPVAIGFRIAGEFVPGIATVLLVVLLLGGIQLITVGIIGEYIGRVYDEVKRRPLYVVDERRVADPVSARPSHEPDEL